MNREQKNRTKKLAKLLSYLAIFNIIIGTLISLTPSIYSLYMIKSTPEYTHSDTLLLISFTGLLIILITMFTVVPIYNYIKSKLLKIKKDLIEKRQQNHLDRGYKFLINGESEKTLFIINKCLHEGKKKSFLSGMYFYSQKFIKLPNI